MTCGEGLSNKREVAECEGAMTALVRLLSSPLGSRSEIREQAAATLSNLSMVPDLLQRLLAVEAGGGEGLSMMSSLVSMMGPGRCEDEAGEAAHALRNMCADDDGARAAVVAEPDGLGFLIARLADGCPVCREEASGETRLKSGFHYNGFSFYPGGSQ